jgi:WD40 repeat protein
MLSLLRRFRPRVFAGLVGVCCGILSAARLPAQEAAFTKHSAPAATPDASLPGGAIARLGTPRAIVTGRMRAAAFSPDGRWLAVISENRGNRQAHIALLDARTLANVRTIAPIEIPNAVLQFSQDSRTLHTSQFSWSVATGEKVALPIDGRLVGISPNGKFWVVSRPDGRQVVWNVVERAEVATLEPSVRARTSSTAISDDGRYVARFDFRIRFDDVLKKTAVEATEFQIGGGTQVVPIPGGNSFFAYTYNFGRFALIDPTNGKTLREFAGEAGKKAMNVAVSSDGRQIAAALSPELVRVWAVDTGEIIKDLKIPEYEILTVAFSADNATLLASGERPNRDARSFAWDTKNWDDASPQGELSGPLRRLLFSPDGRWLAADSVQGKIHLWNVAEKRLARTIVADASFDLRFSPDGWLLGAAGPLQQYGIWEVDSGDQLFSTSGNTPDYRNAVASFSPELDWLAVNSLNAISRLKTVDGAPSQVTAVDLQATHGQPSSLTHSPDGKFLVCTSNMPLSAETAPIALVEIATGKVSYPFKAYQTRPGPKNPLPRGTDFRRALWSPDGGTLAATDQRRVINLWDARSGAYWDDLQHGDIQPAFSFDGNYIAGFGQHTLTLYEVASGEEVLSRTLRTPPTNSDARPTSLIVGADGLPDNGLTALAISPDGRLLAGAFRDDDTILLWNLVPPELSRIVSLRGDNAEVNEKSWAALRGEDPQAAYAAIWRFALSGNDAAAFLKEQLRREPDKATDLAHIARLIQELDSDQASVRQAAADSLRELGDSQPQALERASNIWWVSKRIKEDPRTASSYITSDQLARIRTIIALESNGSSVAAQVLRSLAEGPEDQRQTWFARSSLKRLYARGVQ